MSPQMIVLILGLAGFTVMADNWVVSPILPSIAETLRIPLSRAGLLITAYMIPFGLFQLIFGPLADRYGKRSVISWSMAFFTIGTGLSALGASLTGLALYRALTGIFAASVMPISLALIADLVPLEQRQSAIGTFMGISFLGQGLSMGIGGAIAYFLNWRGVFGVYAGLAVISTLLLMSVGRQIPSKVDPHSEFLKPYGRLLGSASTVITYLVVLLEGILIVGSFSYLGAYIRTAYGFNNLWIGLIMTGFGVAALVAGSLSGGLAAKWGRRPVLGLGLAFAAAADLLLVAAGRQLAGLLPAVILLGLGFMFAHSTLLTIATEFAAKARGAAMSLVAFCFMGGGGVGTAIGGRVIERLGYTGLFGIYGALLVALTLIGLTLVRDAAPTPRK